jgi:hypothetical protein
MPRSDEIRARIASIDWRGWLALAWVVWFGTLYCKTVIESRGGKIRDAVSGVMSTSVGPRAGTPASIR